jgi:ankyrin repeat protein
LHWVAHYGHVDFVLFLVDHGVDVEARDKEGRTPLDCALAQGHVDLARSLVEHGATATGRAMLQIQEANT